MKTCSKCGVEKPRTEFHKDKSKKDGLRYDCKSCSTARTKAWADKNKERCAANGKKWREANPGRSAELWAEWSESNDRTEYSRNYNQANRDKAASYNLKYKYGITLEEYEEMLVAQDGVCKICEKQGKLYSTGFEDNVHSRRLVVDHCHETGAIRGLLCNPCNWGLGAFKDNQASLRAAADYLDSCEVPQLAAV